MTLSVTTVGDNPQQPSIAADAYIPDQLVAGNLKLVTETVSISAGTLVRGTVLGRKTAATASAAATAGNTGNGVFTLDGTTPILGDAQDGIYLVTCTAVATNSGTFRVTDPHGDVLGDVVVGSTFANQIKFAIADGGADFIVGDSFKVTVSLTAGSYVAAVKTATDGSQHPCAILADAADASGGSVNAPVYLMGEFNSSAITLDASFSVAEATAVLRPLGIFLKSSVSAADPT